MIAMQFASTPRETLGYLTSALESDQVFNRLVEFTGLLSLPICDKTVATVQVLYLQGSDGVRTGRSTFLVVGWLRFHVHKGPSANFKK